MITEMVNVQDKYTFRFSLGISPHITSSGLTC